MTETHKISNAVDWWNKLTPGERDRVAAYYDRTSREAYGYCCSILIGCPRLPTAETRNATGVFVCVNDHCYVITANHVVEGLWRKLEEQGPAHFQINQLIVNPAARTVYSQAEHDLVVLAIDSSEIKLIGRSPYRSVGSWPPPLPRESELVQLTGFAAHNRKNGERGTIENYSLHLVGRVMNPRNSTFYARIERDGVPTENVMLIPPTGGSLGGMSGGPVTQFSEGPLPLVGIISEMSHLMDAVRVCALSEVRIPERPRFFLPTRTTGPS